MKEIVKYQSDDGQRMFDSKEECQQYDVLKKVYVIVHFIGVYNEKIDSVFCDYKGALERLEQLNKPLFGSMITSGVTCESYKIVTKIIIN